MGSALLLLAVLVLLLLNAFFVLAEFAVIKVRPTRVEELNDAGHPRAKLLQYIQKHLDEYLSVCQVGITLASIGLGFVGEPAIADLIQPLLEWAGAGSPVVAHSIAFTIAYVMVSFLHIVFGELIPKTVAIRRSEQSALWCARLLDVFHRVFWLPLQLLNGSVNLFLKLCGMGRYAHEPDLTEDELRIVLERSQATGLISFRRLLLFENVFDLGDVRVKDAMRWRDGVKVLRAGAPWEENLKTIRETRFSRYPLVEDGADRPIGKVHVKDVLYAYLSGSPPGDLRKLARPLRTTTEDVLLETLLAELQRHRGHVAIVVDKDGKWTGLLTLEDIIEEIIGTVEDEFEVEPPLFLADALTTGRIVLGVQAASLEEGIRIALGRVPAEAIPLPLEKVSAAVIERERTVSTYLGRGLAIPHGRMEGLEKPTLVFARSEEGIPVKGGKERAHLMFILLTPAKATRLQPRLLARIVGLMESEYVWERLHDAPTPEAVLEAIVAGEGVALG